jgi:hypothetical protein
MATQVGSWPALARLLGWRDRGPSGLGFGRGRNWFLTTKLALNVKLAWGQHGHNASHEGSQVSIIERVQSMKKL